MQYFWDRGPTIWESRTQVPKDEGGGQGPRAKGRGTQTPLNFKLQKSPFQVVRGTWQIRKMELVQMQDISSKNYGNIICQKLEKYEYLCIYALFKASVTKLDQLNKSFLYSSLAIRRDIRAINFLRIFHQQLCYLSHHVY